MSDVTMRGSRRRFLTGVLGAAAAPWAAQAAAAERRPGAAPRDAAQVGAALHKLPRHALVIGNARYKQSPLLNPLNDARAIASSLERAGFDVALHLDAERAQMEEAIARHAQRLAERQAVGLFYFAGHGVQLAWRNYLLPVDAVVRRLADIEARAVDLASLLKGLGSAGNPMNVVILDACRDNPFGRDVVPEQKGLSQFDAPPGSLLAYATAPGNVASDGEGEHGLYSENLARELAVPETKIEDVFKRVRLNVRRRSQGLQVPWESTSLEDDFYFLPPKTLRPASQPERDRAFETELSQWEKIKGSADAAPLEDYLRRYPSGRFAEVVQARLDQILARHGEKKVEPVAQAPTPFTQGSVRHTAFRVGDAYTYRAIDLYTRLETERAAMQVTAITDTEVIWNNGRTVHDLLGNPLRLQRMEYTQPQFNIPEYSIGRRWTTRFRTRREGDTEWFDTEFSFRVVARERVKVPAGEFDAFRVEGRGYTHRHGIQIDSVRWIADGVKRPIATESLRTQGSGRIIHSERTELVSYSHA